jgi:hypothetical protein
METVLGGGEWMKKEGAPVLKGVIPVAEIEETGP